MLGIGAGAGIADGSEPRVLYGITRGSGEVVVMRIPDLPGEPVG